MQDAISIEDLHRPTVVLVNEGFVVDGRSAASNKGMPAVRLISETVPCECGIEEEADAGIRAVFDQVVDALVRPLDSEEASPQPKKKDPPQRIAFKGSLHEFNRFYYKRGWGDGLPLYPPTEEAVAEMLTGTDLPPDHVVAEIVPRQGKATVEQIAVNAVMAGALPIHMPILVAAVEAASDPVARLGAYGSSTGSWAPLWMINGPVRAAAHVNCSTGSMSPGNITNSVIGRAMQLIIKNAGGARKGIEDMGVYGNPGKGTSVIGENEEGSPWEPLHVEAGCQPEDSAVTVFFPNCFTQVWQYGADDRGILDTFIYNVPPGGGLTCLLLTPNHAAILAKRGWTKEKIKKYVFDYGRNPAYRTPSGHRGGGWTNVGPENFPPGPMDAVASIPAPDYIKVFVAGGPGAFLGIMSGSGMSYGGFVTRKIQLPANWKKLTAKYKSFVPVYEKY